jgi:ankyrin repeat protein
MRIKSTIVALLLLMWAAIPARANNYEQLAAAIKAADAAKVNALLDAGLSPMVAGTPTQSAPLVVAVVSKQPEIARLLLARGAQADARHATYYNATALMLAVNNRDIDMAKLLLGAGANVNLTDKAGDSALNWATFYGDAAMAELLLAHRIDATLVGHGNALEVALRRGHQQLVERYTDYLGRRQLVAAKDQAMFAAIAGGKLVDLKAALANGANVHASDSTGRSALGLAARSGQLELARALLEAGARVDAPDLIGYTPLLEAARDGKLELATLLLAHKANISHRSADNGLGLTALHLATAGGHQELVKLLVARGAAIDARDIELATPLLWATNQHPDIAVLLVKLGANPDIAPKEGDAPRLIAQKRKMAPLLEAIAARPSS